MLLCREGVKVGAVRAVRDCAGFRTVFRTSMRTSSCDVSMSSASVLQYYTLHRRVSRDRACAASEMAAFSDKPIRGVVFDLDGTLLDTEELSSQSLQQSVGKFGKQFTWEVKQKILGLRKESWAPIVIAELGLEGQLSWEELGAQWEHNLHELSPQVKKCDGAEVVTKRLKDMGVPQGIATSSSKAAVSIKRQNHEGLFERMECVVAGDDPEVVEGKPAPDIYLSAARRMGIKPQECLAFEDALSGVRSAKAAGMLVVAVPDPRLDKAPFLEAGADLLLGSLGEWDPSAWRLETDIAAKADA